MGVGICGNLWIEYQESLGISLLLHPISRIRVVHSPLMMTYEATGSCYGLQLDAIIANSVHSWLQLIACLLPSWAFQYY